MSRPLRIAFFSYSAGMGGAEHSLLGLLKHMPSGRFEPILFHIEQGAFIDEVHAAGIKTVQIPFRSDLTRFRRESLLRALAGAPRSIIAFFSWMLRFRRAAKKFGIDCIHANQPKSHLLTMLAAGRLPYLLHLRDLFDKNSLPGILYAILFSCRRGRIIAISQAVRNSLRPRLLSRACVVYNGIEDPESLKSTQEARKELGVPTEKQIICCLGRLAPWKGVDIILQACAMVPEPRRPFLLVVGSAIYWESAYEDFLRRYSVEIGLADQVRFTGYQKDIGLCLRASLFLVHAAKNEPFGRVLVEAAKYGRPALAFNGGGVSEIVQHGVTGWLVSERSVSALSKGLEHMLARPEQTAQMGERARERAKRLFSIQEHARRMEEVFSAIRIPHKGAVTSKFPAG